MSKTKVILPDSFTKGLICKVHVSLNGKKSSKELKVCSVKARSVIFIEVDKVNRQNIFRKVDKVEKYDTKVKIENIGKRNSGKVKSEGLQKVNNEEGD